MVSAGAGAGANVSVTGATGYSGGWFHSIQPPPLRPSEFSNRASALGKRASAPE